jgi:hypothetical protein
VEPGSSLPEGALEVHLCKTSQVGKSGEVVGARTEEIYIAYLESKPQPQGLELKWLSASLTVAEAQRSQWVSPGVDPTVHEREEVTAQGDTADRASQGELEVGQVWRTEKDGDDWLEER